MTFVGLLGGTTCHSHEITAIADHNHPFNSRWTKSSPTLHFLLCKKAFHNMDKHITVEKKILLKLCHADLKKMRHIVEVKKETCLCWTFNL